MLSNEQDGISDVSMMFFRSSGLLEGSYDLKLMSS